MVNWDQHVAPACYRYNAGHCDAIGMIPFKAMFDIHTFDSGGETENDTG